MTDKVRFGCVMALLLLGTVDLRWMRHGQSVPLRSDLSLFPTQVADWSGSDLPDLSKGEKRTLAADSYLLREYKDQAMDAQVTLFVAYYSSQRSGDALHSPKNCLPGAGWEPVSSGVVRISNPGAPRTSFEVNRYIIEKDGVRQDVLYWYQGHGRMFASEYMGKIYLAWDGITKGRTDGALVRITSGHALGGGRPFQGIMAFADDVVPVLQRFLPN